MQQPGRALEQQVFETIRSRELIPAGSTVLAAVSGGADSVCLLLMLHAFARECAFSLHVAHIDHGIRGEDSREDAAFVEALSKALQLPFHLALLDVPAQARARHLSLETCARALRYEALFSMAGQLPGARIATAHHMQDQAETVLMHLLRGSGLKGLTGMRPEGSVIRPLLFLTRQEIEAYLRERGQCWREDATNEDVTYTRNRVRHVLLPQLEQINPRAAYHISESARQLGDLQDYLEGQVEAAMGRCILPEDGQPGQVRIDLSMLRREHPWIRSEVLRCAGARVRVKGTQDMGAVHVQALQALCEKRDKQLDLPGLWARTNGRCLTLKAGAAPGDPSPEETGSAARSRVCHALTEDGTVRAGHWSFDVRFDRFAGDPGQIPEKRCTKWLAYDTMTGNLCIRTRRPGDYLVVNAQGGKKKLKDYLIDRKIPAAQRDQVLLVAQGSHILWVVGERISEAAKVRESGQKMVCISAVEERYGRTDQHHDSPGEGGGADCAAGGADQRRV